MTLTKSVNKYWRYFENAAFIYAFFLYSWDTIYGFFRYYLIDPFFGKTVDAKGDQVHNIVVDVKEQFQKHTYYDTFITILLLFVSIITIWEISRLVYEGIKKERGLSVGVKKIKGIFNYVAKTFKATFLASLAGFYIGMLIKFDVFELVKPFWHKLSLFSINYQWYSWIYAYLVWELTTWVWHYAFHRVRFFWCFHSPHHAPSDLTITTAWVHFFAEGFITVFIQWVILSIFGVPHDMIFPVIFGIEVWWGTFIHLGERSMKKGRLGVLKYFLITPSHHRVHHAKNPLYMDTNFCTFLPFWDWVFGTLQPLRDEITIEYGITRKMDVTNFIDFYFGEFIILIKDIKNAKGIVNKFLYLIKPPGWSPESTEHTAAITRNNFLKANPELGITSRSLLVKPINQ
jgi:sterol desaturase/sphingolipid hydroxylase (fatty acid hydroxylase superfamily)